MIVQQGTEEVRLRLTLFCRDQEEEARLFAEKFVSRFLNKSQAREGTTRQFSQSMVEKLLAELSRDPDVAMFCGVNDFPYQNRLVEREYWLQIFRDKLSPDALASNPGLTGPEGYAILHVHYAGNWPRGHDEKRPVDLSHRLVITQVNIRHTWCRGVSPGVPHACC